MRYRFTRPTLCGVVTADSLNTPLMLLTKSVNIFVGARQSARSAPIPDDIPKYHLKSEVRRFFLAIPRQRLRDRVLFDLMYRHGLRRREAAELRRDQITLNEGRITIARLKGSRSGVYRLHMASLRLLKQYLRTLERSADNPYLFPGRLANTHISPTTIYYLCRKYSRAAGLRRTNPHAFRHSCGVHAANARLDLLDIADLLGHKSLGTAMRYAAVSSKRRDENFQRIVQSREFARTG
jgi:type 1 fimbriae regulatory protein FimB